METEAEDRNDSRRLFGPLIFAQRSFKKDVIDFFGARSKDYSTHLVKN